MLIMITGTHCSGKSTLAKALHEKMANAYHTKLLSEYDCRKMITGLETKNDIRDFLSSDLRKLLSTQVRVNRYVSRLTRNQNVIYEGHILLHSKMGYIFFPMRDCLLDGLILCWPDNETVRRRIAAEKPSWKIPLDCQQVIEKNLHISVASAECARRGAPLLIVTNNDAIHSEDFKTVIAFAKKIFSQRFCDFMW